MEQVKMVDGRNTDIDHLKIDSFHKECGNRRGHTRLPKKVWLQLVFLTCVACSPQ